MTLIEVLIAMAIFSLLSLMGLQALSQLGNQGQGWQGRYQTERETLAMLRMLESDLQSALESASGGTALVERIEGDAKVIEMGGRVWRIGANQIERESIPAPSSATTQALRFSFTSPSIELWALQQGNRLSLQGIDPRRPIEAIEINLRLGHLAGPVRRILLIGNHRP